MGKEGEAAQSLIMIFLIAVTEFYSGPVVLMESVETEFQTA